MINKVKNTIEKYNLLRKGDSVTVGLSGGADSVTLLHVLITLRDSLALTVSAVHVNHMIRGDEADRDEKFVIDLCERLSVPLTVFHKNIPLEAEKSGESEEECGRRIRYECFNSVVCGGKIATAHTLSDSIETMVFNMLRGSSTSGLSGIPVRRDNIIRPLIDCSREEIENYCLTYNLSYVTDSTNLQSDYSRNYIRREILPMFGKINPSYMTSLIRLKEFISEDDEFLNCESDKLFLRAQKDGGLDAAVLLDSDIVLVRRVLVRFIKEKCFISPESRHIKLITDNLGIDFAVQLSENAFIYIKNGLITSGGRKYKSGDKNICIPLKTGDNNFCDGTIYVKKVSREEFFKNYANMLENAVDCDKIIGDMFLRNRREGDRIFLGKRKVTKSLHKLFIEMKIPGDFRDSIPVICDNEKVLWVGGIGSNGVCCVTDKTENILIFIRNE